MVDRRKIVEYDAIQAIDRQTAADYMENFLDKLVMMAACSALNVAIREPDIFSLHLTCNAPDMHPLAVIPEIKADGNFIRRFPF